jgi:hypothetical protein
VSLIFVLDKEGRYLPDINRDVTVTHQMRILRVIEELQYILVLRTRFVILCKIISLYFIYGHDNFVACFCFTNVTPILRFWVIAVGLKVSDNSSQIFWSGVFLIGVVGSGIQLGPLGTAATNRPIVPAPSDYDDGETGGMMIGRVNRRTRRKPAPVPLCPPQTLHAVPGREPGPPRWEASD